MKHRVFRHQRTATIFPFFRKCSNKPSIALGLRCRCLIQFEAYNISLSQNALIANAALWNRLSQCILTLSGHGDKLYIKRHDIQPLHKGLDSSPRTQNVDHLRTRSCTPGMQTALTPPPSLPIGRDLSATEVESRGMLGEDEESAISDAEQVHISHNAKRTH
jgi:hypothetical protein